ncbi:hypothetical protein DFO66_10440 [Brevibacterium sanguinis]|uniref:Uncharacterized protein n=2 Tax=Brevibacterium TaxID=1696 RepID=A0A366IIW6_9MICO|nr:MULTISPECIES: hypothetical protein [Brevibacterium]RBP65457.1 hypothetical protein DFO66_10440 [Brevibacterium sanguinis]RBP72091.1 hypothetical protein DFO65_10446 [Brevibacterium celere]
MREGRASDTRPPLRLLTAGVAALVLALSGCVTAEGGAWGDLARAVQTTTSAVESVAVTFRQYEDDRTLSTVAETNCEEMLSQVEKSHQQVFTLTVDSADQSEARQRVLDELSAGAKAIASTQDYIEGTSSSDPETLATRLAESTDRLTELEATLEAKQ